MELPAQAVRGRHQFFPVALLVASLTVSEPRPKIESARVLFHRVGLGFAVCALGVMAVNVFIALRPTLYRWRHGSLAGWRYVSGAPAVGTFLAVLVGLFGFGDWRFATVGLVVLIFDSGGLPWFLIATWRDHGFWDE
jgi:hypothetical protein